MPRFSLRTLFILTAWIGGLLGMILCAPYPFNEAIYQDPKVDGACLRHYQIISLVLHGFTVGIYLCSGAYGMLLIPLLKSIHEENRKIESKVDTLLSQRSPFHVEI